MIKEATMEVFKTQWGLVLPLLQVAFILLQITGKIDWNWAWVLSPFWIETGAAIILGLLDGD